MIYLFGIGEQIGVILQGNTLTEEEKAQATLVVESLPQAEERTGFYSVLHIDPVTKELGYVYKEFTPFQIQMAKLQKLVDEGKITQEEMNELL